jgi:hypothetical protein
VLNHHAASQKAIAPRITAQFIGPSPSA